MSKSREKWDSRYLNKPDQAPQVHTFVEAMVDQLNAGSVLDIASGDGAAALYLAANGFQVTATDISGEGLKRLSRFAAQKGVSVATEVIDLEQEGGALSTLGQFDNIVISLYKPVATLWPEMVAHLRPGGRLLLSTFNLKHHEQNGFSRRFCLEPAELSAIHPALKLVQYRQDVGSSQTMDLYLFERL